MSSLPYPSPDPHALAARPTRRDLLATFFERWSLAMSAIGAWLFTGSAIALDHLTTAPGTLVVSLFVLAYLSGGTLAAQVAIRDLVSDRIVNVDLLMVVAAIGAATIDAWAEGAI